MSFLVSNKQKKDKKEKKSVFSPVKFSLYKNKGAELTSLCPWILMADDGIVLLKNGAFCCSYEFIAPDLDSSSASKIASIANLFNSSVMQLGEGWALQYQTNTPEQSLILPQGILLKGSGKLILLICLLIMRTVII